MDHPQAAATVLSRVPQGSVLGPVLFIVYINEVVCQISQGSDINLFADDIALYRIINAADDYTQLQEDMNAVTLLLTSKKVKSEILLPTNHPEEGKLNPATCTFT